MIKKVRAVKDFGARYIDYRMSFLGALFMGLTVLIVNLGHGPEAALVAALKQGTYTFFFAGFIMRTCERLALWEISRVNALVLASIVPSAMAIGFTYTVHSLKGTPEPLLSTVPTMILGPPTFIWWGIKNRLAWEKRTMEES